MSDAFRSGGPLSLIALSRAPIAAFWAIGVVWGSFMASLPDVKAGLGVSDGEMGALLLWASLAAIGAMLMAPRVAGVLGDWAMPVVCVGLAVAVTLPAQMPGPLSFVLATMLMGACTGTIDVIANARIGSLEAVHGVKLMNLNHGLYSFAYAAAALLTGVARAGGWTAPAILLVAGGVVLALALPAGERGARMRGLDREADAKPVPLGWVPYLGGALILVAFFAENATETWSALFIERDLGAAVGAGSVAPGVLALMMGLARFGGQAVAQRVADQTMLAWALVISALGALVVAPAPSVALAYAGFGLLGVGISVVAPTLFAVVARLSTAETRDRAIARATAIGYGGFFLGPPLLGLVSELAGLRAAFGLLVVILVAASGLRLVLGRLDRQC